MIMLLPFLLRSTLLILGGLILAAFLRRQPKAARLALRITLLSLPFLFLLSPQMPGGLLNLPLISSEPWPVQPKPTTAFSEAPNPAEAVPPRTATPAGQASGPQAVSSSGLAGPELLWLGVSALLLASTAIGILRLTWMRLRAAKTSIAEITDLAKEVGQPAPLTLFWGGALPFVALAPGRALFVPQDWEARVSPAARSQAIRHELAHFANRDLEFGLIGRAVFAVCWVQPLVLLLLRQLSELSEHIADDEVLSQGVHPADYARSLAELQMSRGGKVPSLSLSVVSRPSSLRGRVARILESSAQRTFSRRAKATAMSSACFLALASLAFGIGQRAIEPGGSLDLSATREVPIFDSDGKRLVQGEAFAVWSVNDLVQSKTFRVKLKFNQGFVQVPVKKTPTQVYLLVVRRDGSFDYDIIWPRTKSLTQLKLRPPMTTRVTFSRRDGSPLASASLQLEASRSQRQRGVHLDLPGEGFRPGQSRLKTDSQGEVTIKGLPSGSSVSFKPLDEFTVLIDRNHGETYNGRSSGRQELTVIKGGVIEGRVLSGGKPLAEAFLHGYQPKKLDGMSVAEPLHGITDKNGRFRLTNLFPVEAALVCSVSGTAWINSKSIRVQVKPGEVAQAPDIIVPEPVKVTGRVIRQAGSAMSALRVVAAQSGDAITQSAHATPGKDGKFTFWLSPGAYQLHASEWARDRQGAPLWQIAKGCQIELIEVGPEVKATIIKGQSPP